MIQAQQVLTFWFEEISPAQWWRKNSAFDTALRERFGAIHRTATDDGLAHWRGNVYGRLAEIYSAIRPMPTHQTTLPYNWRRTLLNWGWTKR
jgi:uncharacterized protein (DUF924 family)